ncbi:MAG TPA: TolC family protein [Nitrospiraceae bacterium]|nr:TolC family protein [Nitrospiraceae bacterium]
MRTHAISVGNAMTLFFLVVLAVWPHSFALAQMEAPPAKPPKDGPVQGRFLGLKQAIEIAVEKHPALQAADANLKAAEARTEQTRSLYYPQVYANFDTISGVGGINPRFVQPAGAMLRQNLSQYAGGVIANQRLFDFGFTQNLVDSSQLAARAQEQDVNARRILVIVTVQRAYLNSLKRHRLVQIAEDTVRERGIIRSQVDTLYRQQLKSKLDLNLVQVELTNAESLLVKARNELKASFAELNRAMGIIGQEDYVLEDVPIAVRSKRPLEMLITDSLSHPELQRARELTRSADSRLTATKRQYLPTFSAIASAGDYEVFDTSRNQRTGGWWTAGAMVSVPLFTGFLIENQVREANAQKNAAESGSLNIEQALTQQVTNAYLDTVTFAQQIKLTEEQVKTAQEALQLARQRYRLGLGSIVEVTQSEVALTGAQTMLADAQYDYKIAEVTLAYAAGLTSVPNTETLLP